MKPLTKTQIKKVLSEHKKWLADRKTGKKTYLWNADLWNADLSDANLWKKSVKFIKQIFKLYPAEKTTNDS